MYIQHIAALYIILPHISILHESLEVVVGLHLFNKVSQHHITEGIVILWKNICSYTPHTQATYSVGYDSRSLDTSRLDGLEDIHHTFCLQTFQLRVDTQERPTPHNPITGRERESIIHCVVYMADANY